MMVILKLVRRASVPARLLINNSIRFYSPAPWHSFRFVPDEKRIPVKQKKICFDLFVTISALAGAPRPPRLLEGRSSVGAWLALRQPFVTYPPVPARRAALRLGV